MLPEFLHKNRIWKAKDHLELNLAVKGNKKASYRHINHQIKARDYYFCTFLIWGNLHSYLLSPVQERQQTLNYSSSFL